MIFISILYVYLSNEKKRVEVQNSFVSHSRISVLPQELGISEVSLVSKMVV